MQTKQFLTVAALGAALLPMAGLRAADDTSSTSSASSSASDRMGAADAMASGGDVGEFRDNLRRLQSYFSRMRENSNLALASQDTLLAQKYSRDNRHLVHQSLGLLDEITVNWKRIDTPETNVQQLGSKDMARYAAETDDTAFVRNTVWQLQSQLLAAKLNGREDNPVTRDMMQMLDAAVQRSDNPNFRLANANRSTHQVSLSEWSWSRSESSTPAPAGGSEQVASSGAREWREVTIEHENVPNRSQMVAQADTSTAMEETAPAPAEEAPAMEAAPQLPRTGGAPEILYMLGTGLMGVGGVLLRKRRS